MNAYICGPTECLPDLGQLITKVYMRIAQILIHRGSFYLDWDYGRLGDYLSLASEGFLALYFITPEVTK